MTMVGFLWMKLASGSAAKNMTATAIVTATIMIGTCWVMPTAVRIESMEKTRSSIRICTMAAPKLVIALFFASIMSPVGAGSTVWWISLVAFHSRNMPPAIRIRSRQEKAVSNPG